jgi:hypothetical protein
MKRRIRNNLIWRSKMQENKNTAIKCDIVLSPGEAIKVVIKDAAQITWKKNNNNKNWWQWLSLSKNNLNMVKLYG